MPQQTMTACVLNRQQPIDAHPLRILDIACPRPDPGRVLIRVGACGICRTDLHVVEGDLPARKLPLVPGHQIVGRVQQVGEGVDSPRIGDRVGVAWLHQTCGACRFCASDRENLCEKAEFTGWTADGGYAQYATAPAAFVYPLPGGLSDLQVAPLLCAGIIGYRTMRLTGLGDDWSGRRVGLYGFGAAAHIVIQLTVARGARVFVFTRDQSGHRRLAEELGAEWVGVPDAQSPEKLDASMVFAPAGELIPPALACLDKGGVLVLGGIHMSDTPPIAYRLLYDERIVRSVANNTRADGRAFLAEAGAVGVRTHVATYPLHEANEALAELRHGSIRGAGVLVAGVG